MAKVAVGGEFPFLHPQDFCGNSHTGPYMDFHMDLRIDSHMGHINSHMDPICYSTWLKLFKFPLSFGTGKLGISLPNLVIMARVTIMLELPGRGLLPTYQFNFLVINLLVREFNLF